MAESARSVFDKALGAFYSRLASKPLSVETQPPLTPALRRALVQSYDPSLARGIREHLPGFLPFTETGLDVAGSMAGLVYIDRINGIPEAVVPYFLRGAYAAVMRINDPSQVRVLLAGLDSRGYPTDPDKSQHFRDRGRLCPGMLAGIATLQVLQDHIDLVGPMAAEEYRRSWTEPYYSLINRAIKTRGRSNDFLVAS